MRIYYVYVFNTFYSIFEYTEMSSLLYVLIVCLKRYIFK